MQSTKVENRYGRLEGRKEREKQGKLNKAQEEIIDISRLEEVDT